MNKAIFIFYRLLKVAVYVLAAISIIMFFLGVQGCAVQGEPVRATVVKITHMKLSRTYKHYFVTDEGVKVEREYLKPLNLDSCYTLLIKQK